MTFHVKNLECEQYQSFLRHFEQDSARAEREFQEYCESLGDKDLEKEGVENVNPSFQRKKLQDFETIWILKPGENTSNGRGIKIVRTLEQIQNYIGKKEEQEHTIIVQKYVKDPMLYKGRKFDFRCYTLITAFNGKIKAYWYKEGYIRTTSERYNLDNLGSRAQHITNDSVQRFSKNYGKGEFGNKLTFEQLNEYLSNNHPLSSQYNDVFYSVVYPKMKNIARDCIRGTYSKLNPENKFPNFQVR